jgi:hypothetical protein
MRRRRPGVSAAKMACCGTRLCTFGGLEKACLSLAQVQHRSVGGILDECFLVSVRPTKSVESATRIPVTGINFNGRINKGSFRVKSNVYIALRFKARSPRKGPDEVYKNTLTGSGAGCTLTIRQGFPGMVSTRNIARGAFRGFGMRERAHKCEDRLQSDSSRRS